MNWYDLICVHCRLRYGQIWTDEYPRENQCWGCVRENVNGTNYKPIDNQRVAMVRVGDLGGKGR